VTTARKYALPIAAIAIVCLAAGLLLARRVRASAPVESSDHTPPRAAVAVVRRGDICSTLSVAGEFLPWQEVELHAKVAGYIRKINVDIGDRAHAGQVLATLEVPELTAQVQGADAGVRRSQDEITRAQNELARAEAGHAALHAAAVRLKQASDARPGLVALQELDDAGAKDRAGLRHVRLLAYRRTF
jgi:multidrug efflux pump subunit AcrA (membrane-fusion protein)